MGNLKNLLVYIGPTKEFRPDYEELARIQIDNSLDLGWKPKDIVLVANFPWSYNGVFSIVVGDEHYYEGRPRSLKTSIIPYLVDEGIIEKGNLYWNHDFDAFEQTRIIEAELGLDRIDAGLTDYGWKDRWCLGSYFVKAESKDIFARAREIIYRNIEDETAMVELTTTDPEIAKRCKRLNVTYNFGMRFVEDNWKRARKPLRVVHFHPKFKMVTLKPEYKWEWTWDIFANGKNGLNRPLINNRLKRIFSDHGVIGKRIPYELNK